MLKKDLLKLIEALKEEDNIDETLSKSDLGKALAESGLTLDAFKTKLSSDSAFKSFMDSEKDTHFKKAHATWQTNNLENLINEEIKKRFPDKDEKDIKYESVMAELEKLKKENLMKEIKNQAILILDEKKLPKELLDLIVSDDLEKTKGNIDNLSKVFSPYVQKAVEERLKSGSYTPPASKETNTSNNPYSKEHWNLTKQAELEKTNPELAKQLREQSKQ